MPFDQDAYNADAELQQFEEQPVPGDPLRGRYPQVPPKPFPRDTTSDRPYQERGAAKAVKPPAAMPAPEPVNDDPPPMDFHGALQVRQERQKRRSLRM